MHICGTTHTINGHLSPNTNHLLTTDQLDTMLTNNPDYNSQESLKTSTDHSKNYKKLQRRLAQNREAARKSRLKKKAYVQELESGCLKLAKLEQEIERARKQAAYMDPSITVHDRLPGIVAFEKKYDLWVVEQRKKESELARILQNDVIIDLELHIYVDDVVNHYQVLFQMKAVAAKTDTFYLLYGSWKSPVERLFQWLGGFRPSEILYLLMPRFEPLTDTQIVNLSRLRHTCRQAEDALTQGLNKLEQTLAQTVAFNITEGGNYDTHMSSMVDVLESLENFLNQADHLRHRTLQQMSRILTIRQSSRGLLALGEYFQRLRVLNTLWSSCSRGTSS